MQIDSQNKASQKTFVKWDNEACPHPVIFQLIYIYPMQIKGVWCKIFQKKREIAELSPPQHV